MDGGLKCWDRLATSGPGGRTMLTVRGEPDLMIGLLGLCTRGGALWRVGFAVRSRLWPVHPDQLSAQLH